MIIGVLPYLSSPTLSGTEIQMVSLFILFNFTVVRRRHCNFSLAFVQPDSGEWGLTHSCSLRKCFVFGDTLDFDQTLLALFFFLSSPLTQTSCYCWLWSAGWKSECFCFWLCLGVSVGSLSKTDSYFILVKPVSFSLLVSLRESELEGKEWLTE